MSKIITSVQMAKAIDYSHESVLQTIEDAMSISDRAPYRTPYGMSYKFSLPYDVLYKIATEEFGITSRDLLLEAWETIHGEEPVWVTLEIAAQLFSEIPKEWALIESAILSEEMVGRRECSYSRATGKVIIEKTYDMDALLAIANNLLNSEALGKLLKAN